MNCDSCVNYVYDEDDETYYCVAEMDEDDYAHLLQSSHRQCPFWRDGDDYAIVRHQI